MTARSYRLGDICRVSTGQSAPQDAEAFGTTGHPFVRAGSLERLVNGESEQTLELVSPEQAAKYRLRLFPAGTIIFAKSGMSAKLGRVHTLGTSCYAVSHLATIEPTSAVHGRWLLHWFRKNSPTSLIANEAYPSIRTSEIEALEVLLPELQEQQRIAAILDKADGLRRKRQEAIRLADEFLKAVFFERFAEKPRSKLLTHYCDFLAGFAFKSDQYIEPRDGVRLLRGINVGIDRFEWGDSAGYPLTAVSDLARYRLEHGDVVLAMDRPWISTGLKCAEVDERVAGSYLVQRVARLRPKQRGTSAFIMNCLRGNDFKSHCRITETTIPHISPKDFATFPVPTATEAELRSFADIATRIQRVTSKAELAAMSSDELTSSLYATIFNTQ